MTNAPTLWETIRLILLTFVRDDLLITGCIGAGCVMIASCLEKRTHFTLRAVLAFVTSCLWMTAMRAVQWCGMDELALLLGDMSSAWRVTGLTLYAGLFLIWACSVPVMSKANFCQSLYAITVSYSLQNMCERLIEIPRYTIERFPVLPDRLCLALLMAVTLVIYHRLCIRGGKNRAMLDFSTLSSQMMLFLASSVMLISIYMEPMLRFQTDIVARNYANVNSALFSLLIVIVSTTHLRETDSEQRARQAEHALRLSQQRYEQDKELHDAINVKCHDIRHQIAALGEGARAEELRQIGKMVNIYDTAARTNSAALDVVLSGKALACNAQGVTLTALADGRQLSFMQDSDVYALFGNILDNAMEAVRQVQDDERRMISLTVTARDKLLFIEAENFFVGDALTFEEGLPVTTKDDRLYHGFGMRSICMLTEKYGGDLQITAQDGIFRLSIMLPIPGEGERA